MSVRHDQNQERIIWVLICLGHLVKIDSSINISDLWNPIFEELMDKFPSTTHHICDKYLNLFQLLMRHEKLKDEVLTKYQVRKILDHIRVFFS